MEKTFLRDLLILILFVAGINWYIYIQDYFKVYGIVTILLGGVVAVYVYRVIKYLGN
jgi:uncharacterized membrane-anchored protein